MSPNRKITMKAGIIGAGIALLPTVGLAWAFAVTAADYRVGPHIASARAKEHLMCTLAEYQIQSTEKMCSAVGVKCPRPLTLKPEVLGKACEE